MDGKTRNAVGKTQRARPAQGFADALREARRKRRLTQKQLAKELGVDASTISLWINGKQRPRPEDSEMLNKLSVFLRVPAAEVAGMLSGAPVRSILSDDELNREYVEPAASLFHVVEPAGIVRTAEAEGASVDPATVAAQVADETTHGRVLQPCVLFNERFSEKRSGGMAALRWAFANEPIVRDTLRQICFALNREFAAAPDYTISRSHWIDVIGKVIPGAPPISVANFANILIDQLKGDHRLIEELPSSSLRQRWEISADFLMNSALGFRTGVRGLDFLFDGGLLPAIRCGLVILVKGNYGRGKSTLAAEVAASLAAQGQVVFYLATEENPPSILERLAFIGYYVRSREKEFWNVSFEDYLGVREFMVTTWNYPSEVMKRSFPPGTNNPGVLESGLLAIIRVPPPVDALSDQSDDFTQQLRSLQTHAVQQGRYTSVIIDSLDAVYDGSQRASYERFFHYLRRQERSFSILVSGEDHTIKDYLADIVVHLDQRKRESDYSERTLEIEKCRTQNHIRGVHSFTIQPHWGVTVYPSLPAVLSVWKRKKRLPGEIKTLSWKLEHFDLDALLKQDLTSGSTVLLCGPPGTHKLPIALTFLAAALASEPEANVMFVSFSEDESTVLQLIRNYPQLRPLLAQGQPWENAGFNERLTVLYRPPDYLSPDRLVHWLRYHLVRLKKQKHKPTSRLVFSNLDIFHHRDRSFFNDAMLFASLSVLFRKQNLSTLLLATAPLEHLNMNMHQHIRIVLSTERGQKPGQVFLQVVRSTRGNALSSKFEIMREYSDHGPLLKAREVDEP